jgi:hypothetical protein
MPASLPSRAQQPVLLPFSFQPALCTVRISVALPDGFLPSALLYMSSQLSMHSNNLLALACILLTSQLWTKLLLRYFPVRNSAESQCLCVSCCLTLHLGLICALHLLRYRCSKWVYCRSFICLLSFLAVRFTFISFKLVTLTHCCHCFPSYTALLSRYQANAHLSCKCHAANFRPFYQHQMHGIYLHSCFLSTSIKCMVSTSTY